MPQNTTSKCRIFPQSIPNEWRKDLRRQAELLFYDRLKEQLSNEWIVFYDVAWLAKVRRTEPEDGQIDFAIIHPSHGVLLVEVKGGRIKYCSSTGTWTSGDRDGQIHKIKDAFRQIERSKYALKNKIESVPSLARIPIPIYDAVAFPHVRVGEVHIRMDAPSEVVIDIDDLRNIERKLFSIFNYLEAGHAQKITDTTTNNLISLLAPSVEFRNPLAAQFNEDNDEIFRLTSHQFKVLDGFKRIPRLGVGGCAGSGKTVLALLKAKCLAAEGFSTLLTCYNKHLAESLTKSAQEQEGLQVRTFHQLCVDTARASGIALPAIGSIPQDELDAEYAVLLCEAMSQRPDLRYDAIIVDEAQDFHKDWWDALDASLQTPKRSVLYAFYDDNQKIYKRQAELPNDFISFDLYDNIRNSQPIFRCAEFYYNSGPSRRIEPRGPAGLPVEWLKYRNRQELQQLLGALLKRLLVTEQIPVQDIVLLTPRSLDEKSQLPQLKIDVNLRLVKNNERKRQDEIACSTINSFKGLESNVVILTELDDEFKKRPSEDVEKLLYVAMSRAKNLLIVMSDQNFPDSLLPR